MRRLLLALALVPALAFAAFSPIGNSASKSEVQALTRAAPGATDAGVSIDGRKGYYIVVQAAGGQTLSGGGTINIYTRDAAVGAWARAPDLDLPIPASCASQSACALSAAEIFVPRGEVFAATNAVTVSGGTTVTVYVFVGNIAK